MSVLKSKRKPSQFEVFHHLNRLRRDITELLLRDFGYSFDKADKRLDKRFGGRAYDDLTETEKETYDRIKVHNSQHMYGEAMDIRINGVSGDELLAFFLRQPEVRYAYKINSTNVHFDIPKGAR